MELYVIKSDWRKEKFDLEKIRQGIIKAFNATWKTPENISAILDEIKKQLFTKYINQNISEISSKQIGDLVEQILMKLWFYDVAKAFISYRTKIHSIWEKEKQIFVKKRDGVKQSFDINKIKALFEKLSVGLKVDFDSFYKEFKKYLINNIETKKILDLSAKAAIDNISVQNIDWQVLAGRYILADLYKEASKNRNINLDQIYTPQAYLDFFKKYVDCGYYNSHFFKFYTEEDILEAGKYLNKDRDYSYGFTTLNMYRKRYLLNPNGVIFELPQEMYMSVALFLAIPEWLYILHKKLIDENYDEVDVPKDLLEIVKNNLSDYEIIKKWDFSFENIIKISTDVLLHPWLRKQRLDFAKKIYEYTSSWAISLPTPTLMNARTNKHQLSSCFKLNVDDDLRWIYHAIENMAQISKFGWWIWSYLGHIRAKWSDIRGIKWASWWVIPWIKVMNDTAIAVNQLGARAGAISVTLDIWHLDIIDFLELQTERWDIRAKAYDVFPAVSIPDLFMKRMIEDKTWTLFDPKEVRDKLGFRLEDLWGEEFERVYEELEKRDDIELKKVVKAKELFKHLLMTVVETWMPYIFFRDTANRYNPNKHAWMVYSTQLCTEIIQNTKEPKFVEEVVEDGKVVIKYQPGELVTCNLASINVAKVWKDEDIEKVIPVAMRILDNVIDLNFYPIKESWLTARKYRPVGLGFMGLAEHLATQAKIRYDSPEAVEYVDKLFEKYAWWTIKSSVELAKERWAYSLFKWSDRSKGILWWKDKKWFYENTQHWEFWEDLIEQVKKYGVRFGYHQAPAPNTSTSLVVGTTAWVLPVYKKYFVETNSKWTTVNVAPNLSQENFWLYKEYIHMKMDDVIDVIAAIQKWIDQSISFEWLFNPMETSPVDLYNRYIKAWKKWIKTVYYVRSMSLEVEKCESCAG